MSSRIIPLDVFSFVPGAFGKLQTWWPVLAIFLLSTPCWSQQTQSRINVPPAEQALPESPAPLILRPGTQLALILTHPIDSKTMHHGDTVFAETTSPVFVDNQVVIPAGAFVQGKVEKLTRQGSRAQMLMQSVSVALPDGSVVNIKGPLEMTSGEGTAWRNPSDSAKAGTVLAPFIGSGLGTAIGIAAHTTQTMPFGNSTITTSTPKGMAIGSITGLAAGSIVSFVLLARSHHFVVGEGSPLEITLPRLVAITSGQSSASAQLTDQR